MPLRHRDSVVSVFNGGPSEIVGVSGSMADGRVLHAPKSGMATVAIDEDGHASFGLWDAGRDLKPWASLRQALSPLIAGGRVIPSVGLDWGGAWGPLSKVPCERSALGVTELGVVIYAWSSSVTAIRLGDAMRQAGIRFALQLNVGTRETGLQHLVLARASSMNGTPKMGFGPENWRQESLRDFFYIYRSGRLAHHLRRPADLRGDGVPWSTFHLSDGVPVLAYHRVGSGELGLSGKVLMLLLDAEKLRPHFLPGLAEKRVKGLDAREELVLPGVPRMSVSVGLRDPKSSYGLTLERRVWRPAKSGLMTLAVDAEGSIRIGRFGSSILPRSIRWSTLVQGPTLVTGGKIAVDARGVTGVPAVGAGINSKGLLAIAVSEEGDRQAIAEALIKSQVTEGVLLGERGTVDTGRVRVYQKAGSDLLMSEGFRPKLKKAEMTPGASSVIHWTDKRAGHSAKAVATFNRVRIAQ